MTIRLSLSWLASAAMALPMSSEQDVRIPRRGNNNFIVPVTIRPNFERIKISNRSPQANSNDPLASLSAALAGAATSLTVSNSQALTSPALTTPSATNTAESSTITATVTTATVASTTVLIATTIRPQAMTETMTQTVSELAATTIQPASSSEISSSGGNSAPTPTAPSQPSSSQQTGAQVQDGGQPQMVAALDAPMEKFLGLEPDPIPDVPIVAVFLILFAIGAFTHISIYRMNAKRGHKFLLSDLMFDFCMIRVLTCIFRIVWSFVKLKGVIFVAVMFEFAGPAVAWVVNIFLGQRVFRAMHSEIGWHPAFTSFTLFLAWTVPATIILQIASTSILFFGSSGKPSTAEAAGRGLKVGASWGMMLSIMPIIFIFVSTALPIRKRIENFGKGSLIQKGALAVFGTIALSVGTAVRLFTLTNPQPEGVTEPIFTRGSLYGTNFALEIVVIALYALFRIDLLFHIPDGSSGPGDYSSIDKDNYRGLKEMEFEIEDVLGLLNVEVELLNDPIVQGPRGEVEVAFAKLYTRHQPDETKSSQMRDLQRTDSTEEIFIAPPHSRPKRVSRMGSVREVASVYSRRLSVISHRREITGQRQNDASVESLSRNRPRLSVIARSGLDPKNAQNDPARYFEIPDTSKPENVVSPEKGTSSPRMWV